MRKNVLVQPVKGPNASLELSRRNVKVVTGQECKA